MIEINSTDKNPEYTVIWLHGLGADSGDFVPLIPELNLPSNLNIRFIFPDAPVMPVTINNGFAIRAWFDIHGITLDSKIDEKGIERSVLSMHQLIINEESRGIPAEHIFLAGFSQGSVIALSSGLTYTKPLGGIIALSGYLPLAEKIIEKAAPFHFKLPIFLAHGTEDTVVPYPYGKITYTTLKEAGFAIDWHSYPMAHSVSNKEIADISLWLQKNMVGG